MKLKYHALTTGACLALALTCLFACRRSDLRTVKITVPGMSDGKSVRIVTNAILDEVMARYDGRQHAYEVDLASGIVLYHDGPDVLSPALHQQIQLRLREVGYDSRVTQAGFNPTPEIKDARGNPGRMWPDRYTAILSVPGMKTIRDANIVVDAIAYARLGGDDPRVRLDRQTGTFEITYQSLLVSLVNIEQAVASVGFSANATPALLGAETPVAHGWDPIRIRVSPTGQPQARPPASPAALQRI